MQEITPNEETQLIELKQLPVIQEQLEAVKAEIEKRTSFAKSQLVTEETRASVKALRSQLNKEFAALPLLSIRMAMAVMINTGDRIIIPRAEKNMSNSRFQMGILKRSIL